MKHSINLLPKRSFPVSNQIERESQSLSHLSLFFWKSTLHSDLKSFISFTMNTRLYFFWSNFFFKKKSLYSKTLLSTASATQEGNKGYFPFFCSFITLFQEKRFSENDSTVKSGIKRINCARASTQQWIDRIRTQKKSSEIKSKSQTQLNTRYDTRYSN